MQCDYTGDGRVNRMEMFMLFKKIQGINMGMTFNVGWGGMGGMGMGGMGGMGGMPGMPGFGLPQPQYESPTKMKPLSKSEKNQRKTQRKRERDARKKSRPK